MAGLHTLGSADAAAAALTSFLLLDDGILTCALASSACLALARLALRHVRLQLLGGSSPATVLARLAASSLTDRGGALLELDITFCHGITNELLKALPKLPALQVLRLDGCQEITDDGLLAVAQRCQNLRCFSVYWNTRATDKGFGIVLRGQKGKELQSLNFSGCKFLGDETLQRIVAKGTNLEVLDLTRCNKVTDAGVLIVCESLEKLRVLRLYAMAQLEPAAFTSLKRLIHLEELDLCGCRIEDTAFQEFVTAASPSRLHTLNLTWCPALTDAAALAVARSCPRLTWLSYFGNLNMTENAVEALAASECAGGLRSLDVRGMARAAKYSLDREALQQLLPAVVNIELHH